MNSIRTFLVLIAGITHNLFAAKYLLDVSSTKPCLHWSLDENHQNMYYFQNNYHSSNQCNVDRSYHIPDKRNWVQSGYAIDLQNEYLLREIIFYLPTKSDIVNRNHISNYTNFSFTIYIDDTLCPNISESQKSGYISIVLNCTNFKGRTVTVISDYYLLICRLQILACGSGFEGDNCDKRCLHRYGISCSLPCECKRFSTCNRHTGLCKHGCSNSDGQRNKDCYFKSIEMSSKSFIEDFFQDEKSIALSFPFKDNTKSCYTITFSETEEEQRFWIEWKFSSPKFLKAIEFNLYSVPLNSFPTFSVTIDNRPCLYDILQNSTRSKTYQCDNPFLQGTSVRLIVNKNDDGWNTGNNLPSICDIKLLACHPGYFGPFCRLPCNCLVLPCHPKTGYCENNRCIPGHKGSNCAQVDLTKAGEVFITEDTGTIEDIPALFPSGPIPYSINPSHPAPLWTVMRSIELTGAYRVNHLTVTFDLSTSDWIRNISAYMDTKPADNKQFDASKTQMTGLPCVESYPIATSSGFDSGHDSITILMECPRPAAVVTVVMLVTSPLETDIIRDVGIWTCMDGTFGHRCDRVCNCKKPNDVCDKITGKCLSKCPSSHRGSNCQEQICPPGRCLLSCADKTVGCYRVCLSGWMGTNCNTPCPDGFFGVGCLKACRYCNVVPGEKTCDPNNGICYGGCKIGYSSFHNQCDDTRNVKINLTPEKKESNKKVFYVIGVLFVMATTFTIVLCSFKKSGPKSVRLDSSPQGLNVQPMSFKNMDEGFQWVESMKRIRAFDLSCEYCNSTDLAHLQKVAIWILCQPFEEDIHRRRKKLENANGEVVSISEASVGYASIITDDLDDAQGVN